eukprot:TRINITY_DN12253_c1_g1_i2.p1 TRINITY_DN12253_c1_g1~~TRINITY_DN12253_c1_g1_i2.p1  ORF type:complete len:353 (-),score=47.82 TRINITY_DN12253_c1_g1_i2:25-993(-)
MEKQSSETRTLDEQPYKKQKRPLDHVRQLLQWEKNFKLPSIFEVNSKEENVKQHNEEIDIDDLFEDDLLENEEQVSVSQNEQNQKDEEVKASMEEHGKQCQQIQQQHDVQSLQINTKPNDFQKSTIVGQELVMSSSSSDKQEKEKEVANQTLTINQPSQEPQNYCQVNNDDQFHVGSSFAPSWDICLQPAIPRSPSDSYEIKTSKQQKRKREDSNEQYIQQHTQQINIKQSRQTQNNCGIKQSVGDQIRAYVGELLDDYNSTKYELDGVQRQYIFRKVVDKVTQKQFKQVKGPEKAYMTQYVEKYVKILYRNRTSRTGLVTS